MIEGEDLCIIDGGGNRPDFDQWIANCVNLVIMPITPDSEAVDIGLAHRERLMCYGACNVKFLLNSLSSNWREKARDEREYFHKIPNDLVLGRLAKVAAVKRLVRQGKPVSPCRDKRRGFVERNRQLVSVVGRKRIGRRNRYTQ